MSRFDPEKDEKPRYESYQVPFTKGMRVLDAIRYIQRHHDPTLAYRWNCREGICGSCSMEVDGKPVLTCKKEITTDKILIEPMKVFPTLKDLVPDVTMAREKLAQFKPYFIAKPEEAEKKDFWTIKEYELHEIGEGRSCIECYLCYDVCHVLRNHKDMDFVGPQNIVKIVGLDRHPKNGFERIMSLEKEGGIWNCNMTRCCTEVCPQGIKITENFITYAKERIVEEHNIFNKAVRWIRGKPGPFDSFKERGGGA